MILLITSLISHNASAQNDTIRRNATPKGLDTRVSYNAKDSIRFDIINKKVYLYGDAEVTYEDSKLTAAYIELNLGEDIVVAEGVRDSTGRIKGSPVFIEDGKTYPATSIRYNFKTKKGYIREVSTQEGEGRILGETIKKDSNNHVYIRNGQYTTCNLPHPHYSIKAGKLKVIPEDKIVTGPAYLSIADIPTPLGIPFGFFPNKKGQSSGILVPSYGESPALGFFLKDGGYYFGINDSLDFALRGDIYSRGSWAAKASSNYKIKYKYAGNLILSYARILLDNPEFRSARNDFFVRWSHNQDPKFHPSTRFSANVNAGSSTFNTFNANRPNDYLSNIFQSNIAWSRSFGTRYNLSTNLRHSQNTITKQIDLTVPEVAFTMTRRYLFKELKKTVRKKWYDKIGVSYFMNLRNDLSTYDSLFFREESLKHLRNGMRHSIPIAATYKAGPFNFNTNANLNSNFYLKTIRKNYNAETGIVETDTVNGFRASTDFNFSSGVSTQVFTTYTYRKGFIKAIRHVMTPNVSLNYRPDFGAPGWGYYKNVQTTSTGNFQQYSIFQDAIYGSPASGKSALVSLGVNNNIEMKRRVRTDTGDTERKVPLLEAFSIFTSYNLAAENFNWSVITMNGRTTLFKVLNLNFSASMDPYRIDEDGRRIERFEWTENRRIGRLTYASLSTGTTLLGGQKKKTAPARTNFGTQAEIDFINSHPDAFVDFNVPWSLGVYYDIRYSKPSTTEDITQNMRFNGDVSLTRKWKIGFSSGYDFEQNDFSYTSVNIYRDLHCWEMSFNWIPFGIRQSYTIDIKVKSAILQDLKLSRKRDWYDYQ